MTRFSEGKRRTFSAVVGIALLGALAFGVSQAFAAKGHAVSPILNHRDECASPSTAHTIGRATFDMKGSSLKVTVSINNGDPGDYYLELWMPDGSDCQSVGPAVKFKVDASGNGSATLTADVSGDGRRFFAAAYDNDTGTYNESDYVKL